MSVLSLNKTWIFGGLSWLIPFIAAFPFFDQNGEVATDIFIFKAVMWVIFGLVSTILMAMVMRDVTTNSFTAGATLGIVWFALNIGLDLIILVGIMGNPISEWFLQTGVIYVNFIPLGFAMGWLLSQSRQKALAL